MSENLRYATSDDLGTVTQLQNAEEFIIRKFNSSTQKFELKRLKKEDLIADLAGPGNDNRTSSQFMVDPGVARGAISMGRVVALLKIKSTAPARIRMYCSEVAGDSDLNRSVAVFPNPASGLMAEFVATPEMLVGRISPGVTCYNDDTPTSPFIYYTIESETGAQITLTYLVQEA